MEKEASCTPTELIEISDEDELVVSSICPRQTNLSGKSSEQSSKSWVDPVKVHSWTDLPKCMKFIAKNGCIENRSFIWARRTLDRISATATPEQLIHILNGYADLYKLVLYFIQINDNIPVGQRDIRVFGGTSSNIEQQKRHRNIAFIMFNSKSSLFTSLYATHSDGQPQTCFTTDDENITDYICHLFRGWNHEISQRSTQEMDHISDNNDATRNVEESQQIDSLDALLPFEPTVQYGTAVITSKISENDIQHSSQTIGQSNFHSNGEEIITNSEGPMANNPNSSSDINLTEENVRQHLDHMKELLNQARRLQQEVDDIPSMETHDRQLLTSETLKERELISQSTMINMTKSKTGHGIRRVRSSNQNRSQTPVCLSSSITQPTTIIIPNDQIISTPVQLYDPPNVTKQPKHYRRVRMLTDLAKHDCPFVQTEEKSQRSYPEIEVPSDEGLHIRLGAVTENGLRHPSTTVAPEGATVDWTFIENSNERSCLQCDPDSFDPALECVYLPITDKERQKCRKRIKVYLFNWKNNGQKIKEVIEHENLRLCKLEFYLCRRRSLGQYDLVSRPSYSSVIEQGDGDVIIDGTKIEPKQLCELGGEKIIVPLNVSCQKKGFKIECNGTMLKTKDFTMERKKLLITSAPKDEENDELHLIIIRIEYVDNSSELNENQLYNDYLPYVGHGQCSPNCSKRVPPVTSK